MARQSSSPDYVRTEISRWEARSTTISSRGIVAAEHPLAAQAGAVVLARGGHAVDAAIAANAVMGVVAPMMNGVGGDLFAIVYDAASDQVHGLNASGWSPAGASIERLTAHGVTAMPQGGIHAVTVPGAVAGWAALHETFGRVPFDSLFSAAIAHADQGFPLSEITALEWRGSEPQLRNDPSAAALYLPNGRAPVAGEIFRNAGLARSLRAIARDGDAAFYRGDIASQILRSSEERGGAFARADLAEYRPEWVLPLTTSYRGWDLFEMPPNSQGVVALLMLNILEHFPMGDHRPGSPDALHAMIEAKKLAFADVATLVVDPRFSRPTGPGRFEQKSSLAAMLSKEYARERARLIDPRRASRDAPAQTLPARAGDTTYLCAVDASGNMASLIQSNFANFGSCVVPPGTGFVLQSRGALFSLDPRHPNALEPRKRPLHTIIPAFMKHDRVRIAFGIMGGWNQPQAHVQFISNVVDHGLTIQQALEAPRFVKLTFAGADVMLESRFPTDVHDALASRGHEIERQGEFSNMMGGGQAVMRDEQSKVNYGASDPRKDGAAIPEPFLE